MGKSTIPLSLIYTVGIAMILAQQNANSTPTKELDGYPL